MAKTNCTASAAVRLMLKHPFWCELYYSMKIIEDESIPTLATNGECMWVNPPFWNKLSLDERISALAHEVGHKMLLHMTRRGNRDPFIWNVAGDYVINNLLQKNKFVPIRGYWLYDPKYDNWSTEAVYADLMKQAKPRAGGGYGGNIPQAWQDAWKDIKDVTEGVSAAEIEKIEEKVIQQVERALIAAQSIGSAPLGVGMDLPRVYTTAEEPWYNHLRRYMQSMTQAHFDWSKMNRRQAALYGMCAPDNWSPALGDVLIFIDCSGSCFDALTQNEFASHVSSILGEAKPKRVVLAYFDEHVHSSEEIEPHDLDVKLHPKGGGGTSFRHLIPWAIEHGYDPEVIIIATDMYGAFPSEPSDFPVVWASTTGVQGPWGHTVHIK